MVGQLQARERKGRERVCEANLIAYVPVQCQALFEQGGGPRKIASTRGDLPQSKERYRYPLWIVELAIELQALLAQGFCSHILPLPQG